MSKKIPLKISIIMPCYGMGDFIEASLSSVASQTDANWELIAVDDCGPEDGTLPALERFAARYPKGKVHILRHNTNRGVSAARNTGIRKATGSWLAFLDPDDAWKPNYLNEFQRWAQTKKSTTNRFFVIGRRQVLDLIADAQGAPNDSFHPAETFSTAEERNNIQRKLEARLNKENFIGPSQCLVPIELRNDGDTVFDENPALQHIEDWDLWLRLLSSGYSLVYLPEMRLYYRRHPQSATIRLDLISQRRALLKKHRNNTMLAMSIRDSIRQDKLIKNKIHGTAFERFRAFCTKKIAFRTRIRKASNRFYRKVT